MRFLIHEDHAKPRLPSFFEIFVFLSFLLLSSPVMLYPRFFSSLSLFYEFRRNIPGGVRRGAALDILTSADNARPQNHFRLKDSLSLSLSPSYVDTSATDIKKYMRTT